MTKKTNYYKMVKLKKYQKAILDMLKMYERDPQQPIQAYIVADTQNHHYQLVEAGWQDENSYYFNTPIHLHIKETGKIWVFENRTEDDIAQYLMERGVAKSDIVLHFIPERVRQYTGFATT